MSIPAVADWYAETKNGFNQMATVVVVVVVVVVAVVVVVVKVVVGLCNK